MIDTVLLQERIAKVEERQNGIAHRIDALELVVKEDLSYFRKSIDALSNRLDEKIEPITTWMNRSIGSMAALVLVSSVLGGVVSKLILKLLGMQ